VRSSWLERKGVTSRTERGSLLDFASAWEREGGHFSILQVLGVKYLMAKPRTGRRRFLTTMLRTPPGFPVHKCFPSMGMPRFVPRNPSPFGDMNHFFSISGKLGKMAPSPDGTAVGPETTWAHFTGVRAPPALTGIRGGRPQLRREIGRSGMDREPVRRPRQAILPRSGRPRFVGLTAGLPARRQPWPVPPGRCDRRPAAGLWNSLKGVTSTA
jgi:hypothetical protein